MEQLNPIESDEFSAEDVINKHININIAVNSKNKYYEPGKPLPPTEVMEIASYLIIGLNIKQTADKMRRSRHAVKRVFELLENDKQLFYIPTKPKESGIHTSPKPWKNRQEIFFGFFSLFF